jgi:hypothetical protein
MDLPDCELSHLMYSWLFWGQKKDNIFFVESTYNSPDSWVRP